MSRVRSLGLLGFYSPLCSPAALRCRCGVLGLLPPLHRCAGSVHCSARVRCPGPPGSCSPVCSLVALCCVFAVSPATRVLFTGVLAQCTVLRALCPAPLNFCSPVCLLGVFCRVCGLGPFGSCSQVCRSVRCLACAVSWATWLLSTGVLPRCFVMYVRCPGPLGSCSPVFPLGVLFSVCGVLGHLAPFPRCVRLWCCVACAVSSCHLAPVHRCLGSVFCVVCAVSWATSLLFTCLPARWVVSRVQCPGPLSSCSPVRCLGVLCCVCGVLGNWAPVHGCTRLVGCVAYSVS